MQNDQLNHFDCFLQPVRVNAIYWFIKMTATVKAHKLPTPKKFPRNWMGCPPGLTHLTDESKLTCYYCWIQSAM